MAEPELSEEEKAAVTLGMAEHDPLALARQNAMLRSSLKGVHTLLIALVQRAAGPVVISIDEVRTIQESLLDLDVKRTAAQVTLKVITPKDLAIVPKAARRKR